MAYVRYGVLYYCTTVLYYCTFQDIQKNYKRYQSQFEAEDKMQQSRESDEVLNKRRALMDDWNAFRKDVNARAAANADVLKALRPDDTDELETTNIEETFEVFVREEVQTMDVKIK